MNTMNLGHMILVLTVYAVAAARVTRLINADTILDRPRLAIASAAQSARIAGDDAGEKRWNTALYFVQCPWCVSMWVALGTAIVPARLIGWPWWGFLPLALATSQLVGVFARFADTEDIDYEDETVD